MTPFVTIFLTALVASASANFCWRRAYGRGVGTIPTDCGPGNENRAGLCYPVCKEGYKGVGPACWRWCPDGWHDHGIGCTKPAPYGRGVGYPWKFGDKLNDEGMKSRCEADHGVGNCEKVGLMFYPKCKPHFHKFGCCICTPDCPTDFKDAGITCIKPNYHRGAGTIPESCYGGKEYDVGLCYTPCESGYHGVGPLCWGNCGDDQVSCGAGCASTPGHCLLATKDHVISLLEAANAIAAMVASADRSDIGKEIMKKAAKEIIKKVFQEINRQKVEKELYKLSEESGEKLSKKVIDILVKILRGEDFDPFLLDPTGITLIIKAYNKRLC